MCGIVGMVSLTKSENWALKEEFMCRALFVDTLRGFDSTGIFCVPYAALDKEPVVYKRAVPGTDFVYLKKAAKILNSPEKYQVMVGHNRAATQGAVNNETAHPYTHDHITLVHNGTLINRNGLQGTQHFAVDSEDICYSLAKADDPKTVLQKLYGAFALVWYDAKEQCLYMTRNSERPLHFAFSVSERNLFFASEAWMLDAAVAGAFNVQHIYELKPLILMKIPMTLDKLSDYTVEEYTEYTPPVKYLPNSYGHGSGHKDVTTILNEYGYYYRERVKFRVDGIKVYRNTLQPGVSGTCTLHGHTVPISGFPSDQTIAYQVPLVLMTKDSNKSDLDILADAKKKTYIGEAKFATRYGGKIEITLDGVMEFVHKKQLDVQPEDVDLTEYKNTDKVMGPDNKPITVRRFNKLVKHGCSYCTGDIYPQDADNVLWTSDNSPICPDCAEYYTQDTNISELH